MVTSPPFLSLRTTAVSLIAIQPNCSGRICGFLAKNWSIRCNSASRVDSGFFGSLRLRYFSAYPLIEDNSVRSDGSTALNLLAGWQLGSWRLQGEVLNLLDSEDHDVDYFYASRLPGEPNEGVEDIHYHIFEPRQFRLQASWTF